jgi:hypothetical protein
MEIALPAKMGTKSVMLQNEGQRLLRISNRRTGASGGRPAELLALVLVYNLRSLPMALGAVFEQMNRVFSCNIAGSNTGLNLAREDGNCTGN